MLKVFEHYPAGRIPFIPSEPLCATDSFDCRSVFFSKEISQGQRDLLGVCESFIHAMEGRISRTIRHPNLNFVMLSGNEDLKVVEQQLYDEAGFPWVVGCIHSGHLFEILSETRERNRSTASHPLSTKLMM